MSQTAGGQESREVRPLDGARRSKLFFVGLALLLGAAGILPLVLLTPPFQAPDENWHFYRAYELSEGRLLSEVRAGVSGAELPASLEQLVETSVHSKDKIVYPAEATPLSATLSHLSLRLNAPERKFVEFPGSAYYSPLPYLPQVVGIAAGRLVGLGPLGLLFSARLVNCLAAMALLAVAVYATPFAEEIFLLAGLLPMAMYLDSSASPDAALVGCALAFTAVSLSASVRGDWKRWELVVGAGTAAVFCSVKPVYFPLVLAAAVPQLFLAGRALRALLGQAAVVGAALGATLGWMAMTRGSMTLPLGGGHPGEQLRLVLHHPEALAHALGYSLRWQQSMSRYVEMVGDMGWLTLPIRPGLIIFAPVLAMGIFWTRGIPFGGAFGWQRRAWLAFLALSSALLVFVALYLLASSVGQAEIIGVQGRYFLPMVAMLLLATVRLKPLESAPMLGKRLIAIGVLVLLEIAAMDFTVISGFHVL